MYTVEMEEKINTYEGKNILVVGLARSGIGAANLLALSGAKVSITDKKSGAALEDNMKKLIPGIHVVTGDNPMELFESSDIIVISPGVPLSIGPLQRAKAKGVPIIGELELAYQTVAGSKLRIKGDTDGEKPGIRSAEPATPHFIGITGTNGKSTVTTLVDLILKRAGFRTLLGGNIGYALTEEILKAMSDKHSAGSKKLRSDFIIAEISSFQLETIDEFRPKIAAILNVTPDHLDRYEDMDDYIRAKARIFENQLAGDVLVLNADDPLLMSMIKAEFKNRTETPPGLFFFSREREVEGVYCKEGVVYCNMPSIDSDYLHLPLVSTEEIRIKGVHNLENAMAAAVMSLSAGCSLEAVKTVLSDFAGLEHRLELVDEIKGVKFINDSKGTNTGAVVKSLESFERVILIMGGLDKGSDFSILKEQVKNKVKLLVLLGASKEKIAEALGETAETRIVNSLKDAVELAASRAVSGDTVLLSPGCASFDMFKDFEERGRKFKEAVRELTK